MIPEIKNSKSALKMLNNLSRITMPMLMALSVSFGASTCVSQEHHQSKSLEIDVNSVNLYFQSDAGSIHIDISHSRRLQHWVDIEAWKDAFAQTLEGSFNLWRVSSAQEIDLRIKLILDTPLDIYVYSKISNPNVTAKDILNLLRSSERETALPDSAYRMEIPYGSRVFESQAASRPSFCWINLSLQDACANHLAKELLTLGRDSSWVVDEWITSMTFRFTQGHFGASVEEHPFLLCNSPWNRQSRQLLRTIYLTQLTIALAPCLSPSDVQVDGTACWRRNATWIPPQVLNLPRRLLRVPSTCE